MNIEKINNELTKIDNDKIRINSGPIRKTEKATKELLDNKNTAEHYQVGNFDANGDIIEIGKSMHYLDYKNIKKVWYIYQHNGERFIRVDDIGFDNYEAALGAAIELAQKTK